MGYLLHVAILTLLPHLSHLALTNCNYGSSDVYMVFEAATFSSQFIGGIANYLDEIQAVAQDAVSTSTASRVSLTAFTADGPQEYVAINSQLTAAEVGTTVQSVLTTQLGGTVADALLYLLDKNIASSSTGNPVTVIVVFTGGLTNIDSVRASLNALVAANVNVQLFPIGILAFNSADSLPFVTNIITDVGNFGQVITDAVFKCDPVLATTTPLFSPITTPVPGSICAGWHGGEVGLHGYPGRCDKFYQCTFYGVVAMQCPLGQVFNTQALVCDHPHRVLATPGAGCDYCQDSTNGVYPYAESCELYLACADGEHGLTLAPQCCPDGYGFVEGVGCQPGQSCSKQNYSQPASCRSYYQCSGGQLTSHCCPDGQAFDVYTGTCSSDVIDCYVPCAGEPRACEHSPDPDSICRYITPVHGQEISRSCPDQHAWDTTICDCSTEVVGADTCGIQPEACEPDFLTDMNIGGEWGFSDDTGKYIGNEGVSFNGQSGEFGNGGYLTVYHFENVHWPRPVLARVIFQYAQPTAGSQVLFSNGCYNDNPGQATIDMKVNPDQRLLSANIRTLEAQAGASVDLRWNFATSTRTWLQATVRYDGINLELNLMDISLPSTSTTQSLPLTGELMQSRCALRVGRGNYGENTFNGNIDEMLIYSSCTFPPSVEY